jgi:hypothetical protein
MLLKGAVTSSCQKPPLLKGLPQFPTTLGKLGQFEHLSQFQNLLQGKPLPTARLGCTGFIHDKKAIVASSSIPLVRGDLGPALLADRLPVTLS